MLNKAIIIGRLGKDPELKYTQSGEAVARLNVATSESYTDKQGQKQNKTEWHNIVIWGKSAENVSKYLAKGSLAYFEGKLTTRKWQDKQGEDRYTTEIVANVVKFLDKKEGQSSDGFAFDNNEIDNAPF